MQQLLTTEKGQDPAPQEIKGPTTAKMLKMFQIIVAEEVNLFNRITSKTIVFLRDWAPSICSSTVTVSSSSRGSLTHIQIIFLYPSGHEKVNRKDKVFCTNCKRTEGQINAGGVSTAKLEKKKTSSINTYHDLSSQCSCSSGGNAGHPAIGLIFPWTFWMGSCDNCCKVFWALYKLEKLALKCKFHLQCLWWQKWVF